VHVLTCYTVRDAANPLVFRPITFYAFEFEHGMEKFQFKIFRMENLKKNNVNVVLCKIKMITIDKHNPKTNSDERNARATTTTQSKDEQRALGTECGHRLSGKRVM